MEEILSGVINPAIELAITGNADWPTVEELIRDGAIGVALGGAGQVVNAVANRERGEATTEEPKQAETKEEPRNPLYDALIGEQPKESVPNQGNRQIVTDPASFENIDGDYERSRIPESRAVDTQAEEELLSPTQARIANIMVSNIKNEAEKRGISLEAFYRATDGVNAFSTSKADADVLASYLEPIVKQIGNENYYGYIDKLRSFASPAQDLAAQGQADGMDMQADIYGSSVGAATPSLGPQVPTQSKPVTESNWMPEEAQKIAQPGTHERISEARSLGRAESMFAVDEHGVVVNASDVAEDLLSLPEGSWSGVDSDGAMLAAQALWNQGDVAGFSRILDRYNQEGSRGGQAMQARQKWVHTPEGKVAEAKRIIDTAAKESANQNRRAGAEREIKEITDSIENSVPDAAEAATDPTAYNLIREIYEIFSANESDQRSWVEQLAEQLARKVDAQANPKRRTKRLAQQMLDDLVRITKETAPKGDVPIGSRTKNTETLLNYHMNWEEYERAVALAREEILRKYDGDPDMLSVFSEWFDESIRLGNVMDGVIRESGVRINEILRKNWQSKQAAAQRIEDLLRGADHSLSYDQISYVAQTVVDRFWEEVRERSRSVVERYVEPRETSRKPKKVHQTFEELVNLGALDFSDLRDPVYEKVLNSVVRENSKAINGILRKNQNAKDAAVQEIIEDVLSTAELAPEQREEAAGLIHDRFWQEVESRSNREIERFVEPRETRKQRPFSARFMEMFDLGAFDHDTLREAVYEKMKLPVLSSKDTSQIYSLMERAQRLRATDPRQAEKLEQTANKIIASKVPVSFKNKVTRILMDNMLGNFRTLISRNAGGNLLFSVPETVAKLPTAIVDAATSLVTNERYYAMPDVYQAKAYGKGFVKGAKETIEDFKWDLRTSRSGESLDYAAQIKPFSSWACRSLDKLVETGLEIGDRPFYEATYAARIEELKTLRGKKALPENLQQNFEDLAPVEARLAALEAVFQSEGKMAEGLAEVKNAVQNIIEAATGIGLGGQFGIPFTRTPGNILQRTLEYMPGISTVKNVLTTGKEIATGEFDQRRFSRETGRNITGMGIAYLAAQAVAAGAITGGGDDRPDEELLDQSGWQEYSVKIGDKYFSYDWIPILGPLMAGTADFIGALDEETDNPLLNAIGAGLQSTAEMSALSGLSRMFGGYSGVVGGLGDMLLGGTSQAVPSLVRQAARATDNYERSTYDPNKLKQQWNYIKSGIPGLRQTLPVQYDLFGNPIEISDGRGAGAKWFENLLSPSYVSGEQSDPRTVEMLRLRDKGYNVPVPEISKKRDIDGDGVNDALTADELSLFTKSRNSTFGELATAIIGSDSYDSMSDKSKSLLLSEAMSYASKLATAELYKGRGEEYSLDNWIIKANESSNPGKYIELYTATQNLEPMPGNENPSAWQKVEYIVGNASTKDADEFIPLYLDNLGPRRYEMAREHGYTPEMFAQAYKANVIIESDRDENGKSLKNVKDKYVKYLVEEYGWPEANAEQMYKFIDASAEKLDNWKW